MNEKIEARVLPFGATTAQFAANPRWVPALKELVIEVTGTSSLKMKIGDGITAWPSLPYVTGGSGTPEALQDVLDLGATATQGGGHVGTITLFNSANSSRIVISSTAIGIKNGSAFQSIVIDAVSQILQVLDPGGQSASLIAGFPILETGLKIIGQGGLPAYIFADNTSANGGYYQLPDETGTNVATALTLVTHTTKDPIKVKNATWYCLIDGTTVQILDVATNTVQCILGIESGQPAISLKDSGSYFAIKVVSGALTGNRTFRWPDFSPATGGSKVALQGDGHIPGVAIQASAGVRATAMMTLLSDDSSGEIQVVGGTGASGGTIAILTYNVPYPAGTTPFPLIGPSSQAAGSIGFYISAYDHLGFTLSAGALANTTPYNFIYNVRL